MPCPKLGGGVLSVVDEEVDPVGQSQSGVVVLAQAVGPVSELGGVVIGQIGDCGGVIGDLVAERAAARVGNVQSDDHPPVDFVLTRSSELNVRWPRRSSGRSGEVGGPIDQPSTSTGSPWAGR